MTLSARFAGMTLVLAVLATIAVYWTGLSGPFLLDDPANLAALAPWLQGKLGLSTLLFERGAGTFGRPVSMATFALNAWLAGYTPFALKSGNLLIHLTCGLVLFGLVRRLLLRDPGLQPQAQLYAALIAAFWLLHPLHVSTVLYIVQRMAQLSMLICLLGLWFYLAMRERLERGPSRAASCGILLGIPAFTAAAFLAKENGILLPLLCLIVELAYFQYRARPRSVTAFSTLYVLAPIVLGAIALAARWKTVAAWYIGREFNLAERLLSQGRALSDYVFKILLPNPPTMGIYTDDFAISTSLLQPVTTLPAMLFLAVVSALAWKVRRQSPSIFFGWFFFLAAHALEAGPIPLELYFEHRNYLPSLGVLVAAVGAAKLLGDFLARKNLRPQRIGLAVSVAIVIVLALGTHGRSRVWQEEVLIAESSLEAHPQSLRASAAVLSAAINHGDKQRVAQVLQGLLESPQPRHRSLAHLYRFYAACALEGQGNIDDVVSFSRTTPLPLTLSETIPLEFIYQVSDAGRCGAVDNSRIGHALADLANRGRNQPDQARPKIMLRYFAAQFHVRIHDWASALPPAKLAWQANAEAGIAMPLVLAQLGTRDIEGAEQTFQEAQSRIASTNVEDQAGLRWLRQQIEAAKLAYGYSEPSVPTR